MWNWFEYLLNSYELSYMKKIPPRRASARAGFF
jgi:hypothetical protein